MGGQGWASGGITCSCCDTQKAATWWTAVSLPCHHWSSVHSRKLAAVEAGSSCTGVPPPRTSCRSCTLSSTMLNSSAKGSSVFSRTAALVSYFSYLHRGARHTRHRVAAVRQAGRRAHEQQQRASGRPAATKLQLSLLVNGLAAQQHIGHVRHPQAPGVARGARLEVGSGQGQQWGWGRTCSGLKALRGDARGFWWAHRPCSGVYDRRVL